MQTEPPGDRTRDLAVVLCDQRRLDELYHLRARVWIEEGADPEAFPGGSWSDFADAYRTHWVALDEDRMVAAASLDFHDSLEQMDEPAAYRVVPPLPPGLIAAPARVVVDPAYRGRGLAVALLDRQDEEARRRDAVTALRQASPTMKRLLERRGWRDHGPAPCDPRFPGVEFSVMSLDLRAQR